MFNWNEITLLIESYKNGFKTTLLIFPDVFGSRLGVVLCL